MPTIQSPEECSRTGGFDNSELAVSRVHGGVDGVEKVESVGSHNAKNARVEIGRVVEQGDEKVDREQELGREADKVERHLVILVILDPSIGECHHEGTGVEGRVDEQIVSDPDE